MRAQYLLTLLSLAAFALPVGAEEPAGGLLPPGVREAVAAFEAEAKRIEARFDEEAAGLQAARAEDLAGDRRALVADLRKTLEGVMGKGELAEANALQGKIDEVEAAITARSPAPIATEGAPAAAARDLQRFEKRVKRVHARFDKKVEKLERERQDALNAERSKLLEVLEAAQKEQLEKRDLESANAIQALIDDLKRAMRGTPPTLKPEQWEVACWEGGWTLYPADKMTVRLQGGVLEATNTTGVHGHAMFLFKERWKGDFHLEVEFKGEAYFLALRVSGRPRGTISRDLDGRVADWTKLVIERRRGEVSATLGGQPIELTSRDGASPAEEVHFGWSLRRDQRLEVRDLQWRGR